MPILIPKEENIDMGLAASQVRMLSLTSRKASIERDILQGSNRKIALSREMNNLANEYYDALSAERLMYLSDTGEYTNLSYKYLMGQPGGIENIDVKSDYSLLLLDRDSGEVVLTSAMIDCMGFTAEELAQSAENIYLAIARLCGDVNIADFDLGGTFTISPNLVKEICAGKYDTFDETDLTKIISSDNYNLCTIEPQQYTVNNTVTSTMINEIGTSQIGNAALQRMSYIYDDFDNFMTDYQNDTLFKADSLPSNYDSTKIQNSVKSYARGLAKEYFGVSSYNDLSLKQKSAVAMVLNAYGINMSNMSTDPNTINRNSNLLERTDYAYIYQDVNDDNSYEVYFDAKLFTNALYTAMQSDYTISQDPRSNVWETYGNSAINTNSTPISIGDVLLEQDYYDNPTLMDYSYTTNLETLFGLSAGDNSLVQINTGANGSTGMNDIDEFTSLLTNRSYGSVSSDASSYLNGVNNDIWTELLDNMANDTISTYTGSAINLYIDYNSTPIPENYLALDPNIANSLFGVGEDDDDASRLKLYTAYCATTPNYHAHNHYFTYIDASALTTYYYAKVLGENIGYCYDSNGNFQFLSSSNNPETQPQDPDYEDAPDTISGAYTPILSTQNLEKLVAMLNSDAATLFGTEIETTQASTIVSTTSDQHFVPAGENISQWMQNFRDLINDVKFYYPIVTACAKFGYTESYAHNLQDSDYIDKNIQNGIFQLMSFDTDIFSLDSYKDTDYYLLTSEFSKMNDPAQQAVITAWYETEKAEINSKETYWDTLIENLSTELNSITTEIESVQSLIDDAVKKTFDWGKG